MSINRRTLLLAGLQTSMLGLLPLSLKARADRQTDAITGQPERLLSSVTDSQQRNWWLLSDIQGNEIARHTLPGRGHGAARHPDGNAAVIIGRRPATYMSVVTFDAAGNPDFQDIESDPGRHFFGHATYSSDGRWLYTTENDYQNQRGIIAVRDTQANYAVVSEWESGGIGPHELRLLPDGKTLVVANGGILTHPDQPRAKLNLDSMRPNLAYLDSQTGKLLERWELDDHQLSIRHIDVTTTGRVWIGTQYEGESLDPLTLVYYHDQGQGPIKPAQAPQQIWRSLKHYTGSVVFHPGSHIVGISSPRGDQVTFWDSQSGEHLHSLSLNDVCGLTLGRRGHEFIATTGKGVIAAISAASLQIVGRQSTPDLNWDNHLQSLA